MGTSEQPSNDKRARLYSEKQITYLGVLLLLGSVAGAFGLLCAAITAVVRPTERLGVGIAALACLGAAGVFLALAWWVRSWETRTTVDESAWGNAATVDDSGQPAQPVSEIIRVRLPGRLVPERRSDARAQRVAALWKRRWRVPKLQDIRAALDDAPLEDTGRAGIVCFGKIKIPKAADIRFEPVIITPTQLISTERIGYACVAALFGAVWLLDVLDFLPWGLSLGGYYSMFSYIFVMGAGAVLAWMWKGAVRPTYVRIAPGVIQILRYRYWQSKPEIRSYPLVAGTVAIVAGEADKVTLTLGRNDYEDKLELAKVRKSKEITRQVWHALLSTAPTPPLSDEELVG